MGSTSSNKSAAEAAAAKLSSLGYEVSCSATSDSVASLTVVINGTQYSGKVWVANSGSYPTYLCVNNETNAILLCKHRSNATIDSNTQGNIAENFCFAIIYGTNAKTGETGLFPIAAVNAYNDDLTSMWYIPNGTDVILLHRAIFREKSGYIEASFASDLFWGSLKFAPGAIITVGADNFLCLNQCLYAKL